MNHKRSSPPLSLSLSISSSRAQLYGSVKYMVIGVYCSHPPWNKVVSAENMLTILVSDAHSITVDSQRCISQLAHAHTHARARAVMDVFNQSASLYSTRQSASHEKLNKRSNAAACILSRQLMLFIFGLFRDNNHGTIAKEFFVFIFFSVVFCAFLISFTSPTEARKSGRSFIARNLNKKKMENQLCRHTTAQTGRHNFQNEN